jgi:hypothetical protein
MRAFDLLHRQILDDDARHEPRRAIGSLIIPPLAAMKVSI